MAITSAIMQVRRGLEADFDPEKMKPGEWAVSTDKQYVRMCFSPGVCVRMATYDAFEKDMAAIQDILAECQTIEQAVTLINTQISANAQAVAEYTAQAKQYRDETKQFRDEAETSATNAKTSEDKAKVSETNAKISEENAQRVAESLPEDYTELSKAFYNTAIKQKAVGDNIHVTDSAEARNVEFGLYGKATQDGEPTPDNPIEIVVSGSDGSVEVVSCRKNLLENTAESQTVNGVTFTVNKDGSVTLNGTATSDASIEIGTFIPVVGTSYKYSTREFYTHDNYVCYLQNINGKSQWHNNDYTFTAETTDTIKCKIYVASGITLPVDFTFYPMIRLASDTDDTYEPYKETTSTIPTPNGIAGIKVDSGGNYTDENGQQWICDEIVKYADGSGKRIQRIDKAVFDGSDDEVIRSSGVNNHGYYSYELLIANCISTKEVPASYSTHFCYKALWQSDTESFYNADGYVIVLSRFETIDLLREFLNANPVTFIVPITTIITDLSAEEIAEIEKLHTFYPVTNISNDADCGMAVTYLADMKTYIDNRLAQIESAMINNI